MSQPSRISRPLTQRPAIERLINFLRGQPTPLPSVPPPIPPSAPSPTPATPPHPVEKRSTTTLTHADVAAETSVKAKREAVTRIIGHFGAPKNTAPLVMPSLPPPTPTKPTPISHGPFYAPATDHEYPTHPVKPERLTVHLPSREVAPKVRNPEWFPEGSQLLLRSTIGQQVLSLDQDVLLGRASPRPDTELRAKRIDLTTLAGDVKGISRIHAMLRVNDFRHVQVVDMGSTNGTFLNHQRLDSFKPALVKDGDELQLGIFRLRVHFVHPPSSDAPKAKP